MPSARRLPCGGAGVTRHLGKLLATRGVFIDDPLALQALKEACARADDGDEAAQVPHSKLSVGPWFCSHSLRVCCCCRISSCLRYLWHACSALAHTL